MIGFISLSKSITGLDLAFNDICIPFLYKINLIIIFDVVRIIEAIICRQISLTHILLNYKLYF